MATPFSFNVTFSFQINEELFQLHFERTDRTVPWYRYENGKCTIFLPEITDLKDMRYQLFCNKAIEELVRRRARQILPARLARLATRHGLTYNRVALKNVRTRWGSCSSLGNINLSIWLVLVPERLVDYVLIHELSHLKEMNHSPRFWHEVDRMMGAPEAGHKAERDMKAFSRTLVKRYHLKP